jgi:hypothetical protein
MEINMVTFKPHTHETAVPSVEVFSGYINIYISFTSSDYYAHLGGKMVQMHVWGIPHSATIGELLKAVFSLWSVPTTIGKLFKPIGD